MNSSFRTDILGYFFIFLFLSLIILIRPINHDEAYYTYSSLAMTEGKLPYIDYLFHQTPLMIFVYIPVSFYGISSLILGRMFTAVLLMLSYYLIDRYFIKPKYGNKYHYFFLTLFFLNSFLVNWTTVIKVYSLSILLLTIALINFNKFIEKPSESKISIFICFLSLSLLSLSRIVFAINILVFIIAFIFILFKRSERKAALPGIALSGLLIPYILFFSIFSSHLQLVYENIVTANMVIRQNYENLVWGHLEMTAVFFLPQNLTLMIIIFKVRKFDFFEKIIIVNILLFFILHLNTQMLAEYLAPVLPLMIILAIRKWDSFLEISKFLQKFSHRGRIKFITIIYILFIPFGITYLKVPFEGGKFMFNPIQLNSLLSKVNSLDGKYLLAGWEGYSVYSNKIPVAPDQYQSFYLQDYYDSVPENLRKMMMTDEDYKELIRNGTADIIVHEPGNPIHLKGFKEDIELFYNQEFEKDGIIVYVRK